MNNSFKELILVAIGKQDKLSHTLSDKAWDRMFSDSVKQALTGVLFAGIQRLPEEQRPYRKLSMKWYGQTEYIKEQNKTVTKRAAELYAQLQNDGINSLVLKGQGAAQLYHVKDNPNLTPDLRTCGDIDIWLEGGRKQILSYIRTKGWKIGNVVIHHADVTIFQDADTEVHFIPSYTFDLLRYQKYKKWFKEQETSQFGLYDKNVGFAYPSVGFNVVYSLLHIFRHVFNEGIGLRQMLDYYFILINSKEDERKLALEVLQWMGLKNFVPAVMFVLKELFAIDDEYLLCKPDEGGGRFLLEEIMTIGNFGHSNEKLRQAHKDGSVALYLYNVKRLFKIIKFSPSEALWSVVWKPAHALWRRLNGYDVS